MFWLGVLGVVVLLILIGVLANRAKTKKLVAAPNGSTRIETIKQTHLNNTLTQYARAGWSVVNQSSAKSLGSQARVTVTFQKAASPPLMSDPFKKLD